MTDLSDVGVWNEQEYLDTLWSICKYGTKSTDRTGTGTRSQFGVRMKFDLQDGFPILTTKKVNFDAVVKELLWFLHPTPGNMNAKLLQEQGVHIWDEWAEENGSLGPIYGSQWRSWFDYDGLMAFDQIADVIDTIKTDPYSRRMIVSAWNVAELGEMALPPCHVMFQFYVRNNELSCALYQRSGDMFLGVPFNIASYSLLTHMIAQVTGLKVGEFVHFIGDAHIYLNHMDQVQTQLNRKPSRAPELVLNPSIKSIDDFKVEDINLEGYDPQPFIKAPVAV